MVTGRQTLKRPLKGDTKEGRRNTILLVDDEVPILEFGREILGFYGYEILTAENGEVALELFRRKKECIGLVILDLSMPVMDGSECLKRILEVDPGAKIFVSSGYSSMAKVQEMIKMGAVGYLMKPFRFDDFARQVVDILSAPPPTSGDRQVPSLPCA
jgi:two-component system, cell cycle sensor histidine kinase and response regulator CckA